MSSKPGTSCHFDRFDFSLLQTFIKTIKIEINGLDYLHTRCYTNEPPGVYVFKKKFNLRQLSFISF